MANEVAIKPADFILSVRTRVAQILPKLIDKSRFLQIVMEEFRKNPKLTQCTSESLVAAIIKCSREGLEPGEECYLIPRWNGKKKTYECAYQRGYTGVLVLARRSGEFANIALGEVREGDSYRILEGTENKLVIERAMKNRGDVIFYWVSSTTKAGESSFTILSLEDAKDFRDQFASTRDKEGKIYGPWVDNFSAMALKTCLIHHLKYQPRSYEKVSNPVGYEGIFGLEGNNEIIPVIDSDGSPQTQATGGGVNQVVEKAMRGAPSAPQMVPGGTVIGLDGQEYQVTSLSEKAQAIIAEVEKLATSELIDKFRASNVTRIDGLDAEADEVYLRINEIFNMVKGAENE